jgi:hypothetical protein
MRSNCRCYMHSSYGHSWHHTITVIAESALLGNESSPVITLRTLFKRHTNHGVSQTSCLVLVHFTTANHSPAAHINTLPCLPLCTCLSTPGCASARELQQQQQPPLDVGGLVNQIGQVASQGIQSVLQQGGQAAQQPGSSPRPLAGLGDALSSLGASLNNRTGAATSPARGTAAGPAPAPQADDSLLADPEDITATTDTKRNATGPASGGLAGVLGSLTSGLANATGTGAQQQQRQQEPVITPPPGVGAKKSAAGAAAASPLAGLAAAAVVLAQLLA